MKKKQKMKQKMINSKIYRKVMSIIKKEEEIKKINRVQIIIYTINSSKNLNKKEQLMFL